MNYKFMYEYKCVLRTWSTIFGEEYAFGNACKYNTYIQHTNTVYMQDYLRFIFMVHSEI